MSIGKILLTVSLTLLSFSVVAQNASVSGYVRDSTGVIAGASVTLKGTGAGAVTDVKGHYLLKNIKKGTYQLNVSFVGNAPQTKTITVIDGDALTINFTLGNDTHQLTDVSVVGKGRARELKESGFNVNAIDIRQYANTTADLNQVLNRTSGIRIREEGGMGSNFNFSLNGLSGRSVRFFIDGVPTDVMGSAMTLNNIPVNLAEQVEVYKGVVPVELGADALGGAINVTTSQKITNYLDASYSLGSWNTNRAALTGQYKHAKTGLVVKFNGFYNYSKNNYLMKGMEIWNPNAGENGGEFELRDLPRFHDTYSARMGQLEVGVVGKKWADMFFIGASYSDLDQDVQTGIRQDFVYGGVRREAHAFNTSVKYRKNDFLVKGLKLNLFGSRNSDRSVITDTLQRLYSWDGTYEPSQRAELGNRALTHIIRPRTYVRANLTYELNAVHSFNVNYTLDHVRNETYNELEEDRDEIPSTLSKHILGISYQQNWFGGRLSNTFFGKYYGNRIKQSSVISRDNNGQLVYQDKDEYFDYRGYGVASRFKILADLGIKASYEYAYRLPEAVEMFGNGITTIPNLTLKPEQSNNINVGAFIGKAFNNHRLFLEGSYYIRDVHDFIFFDASSRQYENKSDSKVSGLEGELRYNYKDFIGASVNASYQNAINHTKYSKPGATAIEPTYLDPIPNQPIFYGNADFNIRKNNFLEKGASLQFNWYTQYVQWFYLSWKSLGADNFIIPSQYIHNAVLTYSRNNGKYNIAFECRNLTDNLAYDNYRLQKPGRSFAVKLRYFIK